MRGAFAFLKKELFELSRSGRLIIFGFIFALFGIMNPVIAKLTPKILEMNAEVLESQGVVLGEIEVTAMESWAQFIKNIPMAMIVTVVMFSGVFTGEYSKGTLIPIITKGLSRSSMVLAKTVVMLAVWSGGFWLCYGMTYGYSAYYWDNSVAENLAFMGICQWLMGIFLISVLTLFSALSSSSAQVMMGVGVVYVAMYVLGMFAKIKEYLPTFLMDSSAMITAQSEVSDYTAAICITAALSVVCVIAALPITGKRQL